LSLIALVSLARGDEIATASDALRPGGRMGTRGSLGTTGGRLGVGVLLGVTAVARSQFLAFVPLGVAVLVGGWWGRGVKAIGLVMAGVGVAIAPVTARNWVVSGQFVPISASGGASLLEFHRPPAGLVDAAALEKDPLFNALHLDAQTRTVVAFAEKDPLG